MRAKTVVRIDVAFALCFSRCFSGRNKSCERDRRDRCFCTTFSFGRLLAHRPTAHSTMSGATATAPPMARAQLSPPRSASRAGLRSPSCPPARRAVSARAVISPPAASGASFVGDDGVPFFALSDADRASELRANPEAIAAAAASPDAVLLPLSGTKVWIFPDDDDARSNRNANRTSGGAPRRRRCATSRRTRSTAAR